MIVQVLRVMYMLLCDVNRLHSLFGECMALHRRC